MDLSVECVRDALLIVDREGWDSDAGRLLLDHVRRTVVRPVVRQSGLRGPVADQAEASGWQAGWDALRRPTARTAQNPGGMVWAAVRRAVSAEVGFSRTVGDWPVGATTTDQWRCVSLDDLMSGGWHPTGRDPGHVEGPGPVMATILDGLVDAGWDREQAAEVIATMADTALPARSAEGGRPGPATTRWRWVSLRLGVPEWQARRIAGLLLGGGDWPGVLELVVTHGPWVTGDPGVRAAIRSTTVRWSMGPGAWLMGWDTTARSIA
jgi:hypothetical protein